MNIETRKAYLVLNEERKKYGKICEKINKRSKKLCEAHDKALAEIFKVRKEACKSYDKAYKAYNVARTNTKELT
ncbi:hypothetical protein LCGC14_2574800 [marine sediment metagenome]|uniref:Uncharacterized protein n=1 Tax=marine sediment metagenome TaxID=412755 RepID=A0A0F9B426_9ZZZZ